MMFFLLEDCEPSLKSFPEALVSAHTGKSAARKVEDVGSTGLIFFVHYQLVLSCISTFLPVIVVIIPKNRVSFLLIYLNTGLRCSWLLWLRSLRRWRLWIWHIRRSRNWSGSLSRRSFVHFKKVKRVLLITLLHSLILIFFFRSIIVISMLSTIDPSFLRMWTLDWVALLSVGINWWLIGMRVFHHFHRLIVIVIVWLLITMLRSGLRLLVMSWFFNISWSPIVSFLFRPGQREGGTATWSLYDFFVSFSIKIGVICNVFVDHSWPIYL